MCVCPFFGRTCYFCPELGTTKIREMFSSSWRSQSLLCNAVSECECTQNNGHSCLVFSLVLLLLSVIVVLDVLVHSCLRGRRNDESSLPLQMAIQKSSILSRSELYMRFDIIKFDTMYVWFEGNILD